MRRVFRLDGALWSEISPALPQGVSPTGFIVAGERVLAGTQGSGVWSAPLGNVASAGPSSADPMNGREAYPNPFSAGTTIEFMMPRRGHATLAIVDLAGVVVRTAFDGMLGLISRESTLVAVLGELEPRTLRLLAGVHPRGSSSTALALLLDTTTWAKGLDAPVSTPDAHVHNAARVLRAAGWQVKVVSCGESVAAALQTVLGTQRAADQLSMATRR